MIGIFDSGIGGMTVARAIEELLPDQPLLYLGDIARSPYGPKSRDAITRYSIDNTKFLLSKGARLVVIACNSASSVATETLRSRFKVPILEVISPAVEEAVRISPTGRIGIIGTRATIDSGIYTREITSRLPNAHPKGVACPLLVPLVEEGWLAKRETKMILRRYLHPLKQAQLDTLVLGCTHYPLLKDLIQHRIGKRVRIIDSSRTAATALRDFLNDNPDLLSGHGSSRFFVTDLTRTAEEMATKIFGRPITLEHGEIS